MTIRETAVMLHAELLQDDFEDAPLTGAYTSDLLSDVMANAKEGGALITIQAHKNTVAVATLANISAIILCNNRHVQDNEMLEAAKEEGIAVMRSRENQFIVSGKPFLCMDSILRDSAKDIGLAPQLVKIRASLGILPTFST